MKRGLVLGGGGARGAYQLGAWRALRELGIDFQVVTGTSIGAINGAFYVQDEFELAEQVWQTITIDRFMVGGEVLAGSFDAVVEQPDAFSSFIKSYLATKGADISPFKQLLTGHLQEERFFNSPVDYGLITAKFPSLKPVEKLKKDIPAGRLLDWLLASAACFPALPLCEIDGQNYIDGMHCDNLPIATAIRLGAEEIVAVELSAAVQHENYRHHPQVTYIRPLRPLGSFLSFDRTLLDRSISLGYYDTMKAYGRYFGSFFCFRGQPTSHHAATAARFVQRLMRFETGGFSGKQTLQSAYETDAPFSAMLYGQTGRPTAMSMFIAAVEICAELLGYDETQVYDFDEFVGRLQRDNIRTAAAQADSDRRPQRSLFRNAKNSKTTVRDENDNLEAVIVALLLATLR